MNVDQKLRQVANLTCFFQYSSILIFLIIGFVFNMNFSLFFLFFTFYFLFGFYIIFILIINDNLCPNCNEYFFKKKGEFMNIGFSMYTKKCTNCGYKLKKELDAKDDLSEDGNDNAKSEK